jgi:hypothetical protein
MSYEVVPMTSEREEALTDFERGIYQLILARGDQNHPEPDRYQPQSQPPREYDYQYDGHTGDISFGERWLTHRLDIEEFQLILAFRRPTIYRSPDWYKLLAKHADGEEIEDSGEVHESGADLYISEFGDHGALARTSFSESEGEIYRARVSLFGASQGLGFTELNRKTGARERKTIEAVIAEPETSVVAIRGLVKLTRADQRAVSQAHKDREARDKEYREHMEAMDRARRAPMPNLVFYTGFTAFRNN